MPQSVAVNAIYGQLNDLMSALSGVVQQASNLSAAADAVHMSDTAAAIAKCGVVIAPVQAELQAIFNVLTDVNQAP